MVQQYTARWDHMAMLIDTLDLMVRRFSDFEQPADDSDSLCGLVRQVRFHAICLFQCLGSETAANDGCDGLHGTTVI